MKNKIIIGIVTIFLVAIIGALYFINKPIENGISSGDKKMAIGIIAGSQSQVDQYQTLIDYINKYADHEWYLAQLKDYGSFITQMQIGQIQGGFAGSAKYHS